MNHARPARGATSLVGRGRRRKFFSKSRTRPSREFFNGDSNGTA